ncbi:hypothetical protein ACMAZF_11065 [Psychrobium sp. nBUS_13]|uniref:hypothetical protein n=1 Tax=Psychrobium sp. nBUS_13 TaxID=3395319 RepID=UPI003EBB95D3
MRGERLHYSLANEQGLDVLWGKPHVKHKSNFKLIDVDLLRGYGGIAIGLIRQGEQQRFCDISSLGQMSAFKIGRTVFDRKTDPFAKHQLNLVYAKKLGHVYRLLKQGYIDILPVELYGAYLHLDKNPELTVEKNLGFRTSRTSRYFIHKKNKKLQARIERGLEILEDNGKFKTHFETHPMMALYQRYQNEPPRIEFDMSKKS